MTRKYGLSSAEAAHLLGTWGLVAGVTGTLARRRDRGLDRPITSTRDVSSTIAAGFIIGGPLAISILTLHNLLPPRVIGFTVAFFFLSWYNGPMAAVDLRCGAGESIGSTVVEAYLLFIHLRR